MVLDPGLGSLIVTDDFTSEVLANITFDVYAEEPPPGVLLSEDDEGFQILNSADIPVMTITNADMEASYREQEFDETYYYPEPVVLFSPNGDDWLRASTTGLDVAWISGTAVGDEVVVISGDPVSDGIQGLDEPGSGDGDSTTTLAYSDGSVFGPIPFVWVGTPR